MQLTSTEIDALENFWIDKSRVNFLAYRRYIRYPHFLYNWFVIDLAKNLQQFYEDLINGKRPILLIQSPPQHGKSIAIYDFLSWISGRIPEIRSIYTTYSDMLGVRCNTYIQRTLDSEKYNKIFPETCIGKSSFASASHKAKRNSNLIEFLNSEGLATGGLFRNTTTGGSITGESLDLGVIDDAVKGREQANSLSVSQKIWEWFNDDFSTRFSDKAGLLVIMTRWTVHDIIARMIEIFKETKQQYKLVNYEAIASIDEDYRKEGDPLFPELKSKVFLEGKKILMAQSSWESLYQGHPTVQGGNLIKDYWWKWWKTTDLPRIKYKFITADTAQKTKDKNDYSVFQCWGVGYDGNLYLLDKIRGKWESPDLRRIAIGFYNKHNIPRRQVGDPVLRKMYIEDKSSGSGLIQDLRRKKVKVEEVPRDKDKVRRANDVSPEIELGKIYLNTDVNEIDNLTKEAREFPDGEFDDDFDTCMTAIEVTYLNRKSSLEAAMEAA